MSCAWHTVDALAWKILWNGCGEDCCRDEEDEELREHLVVGYVVEKRGVLLFCSVSKELEREKNHR